MSELTISSSVPDGSPGPSSSLKENEQFKLIAGSGVWARYEGQWREAEIIASRQNSVTGKVMYYVHYVDFNRRMDTWLSLDVLSSSLQNPDDPDAYLKVAPISSPPASGSHSASTSSSAGSISASAKGKMKEQQKKHVDGHANGRQHERGRKLKVGNEEKEIVEFVEEEYGGSAGMDEESIREHEEVTKIKNVNRIELGCNTFETWYYSPIPREYFPDGYLDTLYFCEFTLNFYSHKSELIRHYSKLKIRHPPGDEIYRDQKAGIAVFEVDGAKSKFYSQNLCYLAKFFLDHKTLHYDTDVFLFYVLCELDNFGYHIVGYFSKEKYSEQGNNLACILTLPPYQKKGYGGFIISFSYELSKKEGRVGSPEKPLSDLGQISYRSYWCRCILELLKNYKKKSISIMDITKMTSIITDDVILALNYLGLIRYDIPRSVALANTGYIELVGDDVDDNQLVLSSSSSTARKRKRDDQGSILDSDDENNDDDDNASNPNINPNNNNNNNGDDDQDSENDVNSEHGSEQKSLTNKGKGKRLIQPLRPKSQASTSSITSGTIGDYQDDKPMPVIYAPPELIELALTKLTGKSGPKVDPGKLHWAPIRVDVKRDKWSISSKRRGDN